MGKTIRRWTEAAGRAFLISMVFLIKRWLPLSLSLITGIGLSYLLKFSSESFYSSDSVLRNNIIPTADVITYINRLHSFCNENNKTSLASSLTLDPKTTDNILDISAYWIIDKGRDGVPDEVDYSNSHNIYDTINIRMQDRFNIRVKIKAPQELTLLKNSILTYINKDSLFQQRNRVRLRQNKEQLVRYGYDILQLDSLQKIKYYEETKNRQPQAGGQMVFLQEQKTQMIYPDIQTLFSKKQALEAERDLYPDIVTILSDFNLSARPENGGLYYGKKIIPVCVGLMLLILIVLANWKELKEVYKRY